jgi:peptidoglycan/LPS O-acetylase OafA/YrhL
LKTELTHADRVDGGTELFIDALRGVAALMVLLSHAVDLAISQVHGWEFGENPPVWRAVRATVGTGEHWVWCFFVLSGFCIHLSIARALREGRFRLGPYALARVTRIYPLYLLGLGLALAAYLVVPDLGGFDGHKPVREFWATLLSLQIFTNSFPGFQQSWSLSCEMIYYGVWPMLLWMAGGREKRAFRAGMAASLTVAGGVLVMWTVFHRMEDRAFVDGIWSVSALFVLWLAGAGLAAGWGPIAEPVTRRRWHAGLAVLAAATVLLYAVRYLEYPHWSTHLVSWAAMPGIVLMIAGARHAGLAAAPARVATGCRWLGLFSYPCYILHDQMLALVNHLTEPLLPEAWAGQPMARVAVYLAVILPPLALAGPALERFFMGWRTRLLRGGRAAAATPAMP